MCQRVVEKDPGQEGFVTSGRRWVVERAFNWLSHWRGQLRERAGYLACVACLSVADALVSPA